MLPKRTTIFKFNQTTTPKQKLIKFYNLNQNENLNFNLTKTKLKRP